MRLWIAGFLLFVFACQALPVAALGKALIKVQLSVTDNPGDDGDDHGAPENGKVKKQSSLADDDCIPAYGPVSRPDAMQRASQALLHYSDHLPILYAGEVTSPPPDYR